MKDNFIYKDNINSFKPGRGALLISEPLESDSFFSRSVVLLLDNDKGKGYFGLITNRRLSFTMGDIFKDWELGAEIPVYCGGPVEGDRLFFMHTIGEQLGNCTQIIPGLYVGGSLEKVIEYIDEYGYNERDIRFFLGYSGWGMSQLENEIEKHFWAVKKVDNINELLTQDGIEYWRREVSKMGENYRSWLIVPPDSRMN